MPITKLAAIAPGPRRARHIILLASAALILSACEIRRDDAGQDPEPDQAAVSDETPDPTPETSAVSIIRDDLQPAEPVALPPEPVELVIPFPDGATLTSQVERVLVGVLESDAMKEGWPVVLGGHTDSGGNDQANLRASRARAEAVAAWLVEHGVADHRIEVVAFGEQNPIAPNALPDGTPNEKGRRANRRVELRIAPTRQDEGEPSATKENKDAGEGA